MAPLAAFTGAKRDVAWALGTAMPYQRRVTVTYGATDQLFQCAIGGPPGAARAELPRNFWGYSTVGVLDRSNTSAPKNAYVFWHKATGGAMGAYKKAGLLRADVRYSGTGVPTRTGRCIMTNSRSCLRKSTSGGRMAPSGRWMATSWMVCS